MVEGPGLPMTAADARISAARGRHRPDKENTCSDIAIPVALRAWERGYRRTANAVLNGCARAARAPALPKDFVSAVSDIDDEIAALARTEWAITLADMLVAASTGTMRTPGSLSLAPLQQARGLIAADPAKRHSMAALEGVTDLDRW